MNRDEDMQRMPYAELWRAELGRTVRQYHEGMPPPPRPVRRRHRPPGPLTVPPEPPQPAPEPTQPPA